MSALDIVCFIKTSDRCFDRPLGAIGLVGSPFQTVAVPVFTLNRKTKMLASGLDTNEELDGLARSTVLHYSLAPASPCVVAATAAFIFLMQLVIL